MSQNASGQDDIIDGEAVVISEAADSSGTATDSAQKRQKSARKFLPYFWLKGFWSTARRRRLMWVAYCAIFAVLGFILVGQVMGLKAERDRFRAEVIEQGVRITSLEASIATLNQTQNNDSSEAWQTAMTARIDAIDQALNELKQSLTESNNNGIDGAVLEALLARLDRLEEGLKLVREPPPAIESVPVTESPIESESESVTELPSSQEPPPTTGSVPSQEPPPTTGSDSSQEPPPTTGWESVLDSLITITPIDEE